MSDIRDPQQLEPRLVACQRAGDIEGMMSLYEPGAVLDCGHEVLVGYEAIRNFFLADIAAGKKYGDNVQQEPLISNGLALTSARLPDGTVTAEIARQQADGSWRWVIDRFSIAREQMLQSRD